MAGEIVREGTIPAEGVLELLRSIEETRTSGVLRFLSDEKWLEVELVAGQLALTQPVNDGADPVEVLLAARGGRFEVIQRLPPLAVSKGDTRMRTGSLAVHVPADLMTYCEGAGLTGMLEFVREHERVEVVYDKGELTAIQLGDSVGGDVNTVFAWETGTFKIEALPVVPELDVEMVPDSIPVPPPAQEASPDAPPVRRPRRDETVPITRKARRRRDETGPQFLKVIETTLGAIVDEAEKGRSSTRTSPPMAPAPPPRPTSIPPSRPSRDSTVRIIYLGAEAVPLAQPSTASVSARHVSTDVAPEGALPAATREPAPSTRVTHPSEEAPVPSGTVALAFGGLLLALGGLVAAALSLLRAH